MVSNAGFSFFGPPAANIKIIVIIPLPGSRFHFYECKIIIPLPNWALAEIGLSQKLGSRGNRALANARAKAKLRLKLKLS